MYIELLGFLQRSQRRKPKAVREEQQYGKVWGGRLWPSAYKREVCSTSHYVLEMGVVDTWRVVNNWML